MENLNFTKKVKPNR